MHSGDGLKQCPNLAGSRDGKGIDSLMPDRDDCPQMQPGHTKVII